MPNYVAKKSAWSLITFWNLLLCILIIPIIILVFRILILKQYRIEFYDDKIITHTGLINKQKKQVVFMGVTATSVNQSLKGRIFKYGDLNIDCVGKWDVDTKNIKHPEALENYLQSKIVKISASNQYVHM